MKNFIIYFFPGFLLLINILLVKADSPDSSFYKVKINQRITENKWTESYTTIFEYDGELMVKGTSSGGWFFSIEYDSLHRLIKSSMFGNSGPIIYFTYQYDSSTITRMRYQYYQNTKSYGGDNEKSVYQYNCKNQCERIEYYKKDNKGYWIKSDSYSLYKWANENLIEVQKFNKNELESTLIYEYDDKLNPEKLLQYLIEPENKSKNNPLRIITHYSDGRESITTFEYKYNGFGYPTKKERIDEIGTQTTKYIYDFQ